MPQPPVPQPQRAAGRKLGGLPAWAWIAAIAGGLIVGFFFLRRADAAAAPEGTAPAAGPAARPSGGGAAGLLPPELLEALGLQPPAYSYTSGGLDQGSVSTTEPTRTFDMGLVDPGPQPTSTPWYNAPYVGADVPSSWDPAIGTVGTPLDTRTTAAGITGSAAVKAQ